MDTSSISDQPQEDVKPAVQSQKRLNSHSLSVFHLVQSVITVAMVMATIFTFWNPHGFFSTQNIVALLPAPVNVENASESKKHILVGLQVGHHKHNDGHICDGIKEVDVNYILANKVSMLLAASKIASEVIDEYDLKLINYKADALVSIHTRSCTDPSAAASGFTVGTSISAGDPDKTNTLAACLAEQYMKNTGLAFSYQVIPDDQIASHTFLDINPQTPAVQIETGSLAVDRGIIIESSDRAANGITAGILCYLRSQGLIK